MSPDTESVSDGQTREELEGPQSHTEPATAYYESPQAAAMDQTLAQAENSVSPAVLAALIAAYASVEGSRAAFTGINSGVSVGGATAGDITEALAKSLIFAFKRDNAARLRMLKREMLPFVVRAVVNMLRYSPSDMKTRAATNLDAYSIAEQAVNRTMDTVFDQITESAGNTRRFLDDRDAGKTQVRGDDTVFDIIDSVLTGDLPATALKPHKTKSTDKRGPGLDSRGDAVDRRLDTSARRFSRLVVRDAAFNAQDDVAARLGFTHKRWITMADERVRSGHRIRHGMVVPVGSRFQGPLGLSRWPGDPLAPIADTANCRCSLEWIKR